MKVLAISYMLPPNLYPQAIQIGRLLNALPHEIGAVCGAVGSFSSGLNCYPDFNDRLAFKLDVPYRTILSGYIKRLAIELLPLYARSPDEFRGWVPKAVTATHAKLQEANFSPDVLVSFGEPMSDHLVGLRLKRTLGIPWVAHFSDPWSDNPFRLRHILAQRINTYLERKVIGAADRVIFTSEETVALVMSKYPTSWMSKVRVLPHSYDSTLFPDCIKTSSKLMVRYLGNFYGHRSPRPLFDGLASILQEDPEFLQDVCIELIGGIPKRMLRGSSYRMLPRGLVRTVPSVPYIKSLQHMVDADLLLVIDAPADNSVFLPSKLVDYLGAGVPVLGIVPPGAAASLIKTVGGITVDPSNGNELAPMLRRAIIEARRQKADKVTNSWGKTEVVQKYKIDVVSNEFSGILSELIE